VVIIGGGITGITSALFLSKAGKKVVVLEAAEIGLGTTGYSTGNLYASLDSLFLRLKIRGTGIPRMRSCNRGSIH
jgi:glycine/D-amino acid oxidase-like deaminating enzyme